MELRQLEHSETCLAGGLDGAGASLAGLVIFALTVSFGLVLCSNRLPVTFAVAKVPEPVSSLIGLLTIESVPTYYGTEIRWPVWAFGAILLAALLLFGWGGASGIRRERDSLAYVIFASVFVIAGLIVLRALVCGAVSVALATAWILCMGLTWMLLVRAMARATGRLLFVKAVAVSAGSVALASLLYTLQGGREFPGWPTGNVLLLSTVSIAGAVAAGTWVYIILEQCDWPPTFRLGAGLIFSTALFGMLLAAASLTGRRSAVAGLFGGIFYLFWVLAAAWPRRKRLLRLVLVLLVLVSASAVGPVLSRTGRWQTVTLRSELYKQTVVSMLADPGSFLYGKGPGQLCFDLTLLMRPLGATSPRVFHGQISEHCHNEPLQVVAELGLPLGVAYLSLPVLALLGFARAWRGSDGVESACSLGLGASLAAVLTAEAFSVGMRHPGIAALAWGLTGIGIADLERFSEAPGFITQLYSIATAAGLRADGTRRVALRTVLCGWLGLLAVAASLAFYGSNRLRTALDLYRAGGAVESAYAILERAFYLPTTGQWLLREYSMGRYALLAARARSPDADLWRQRAQTHLFRVVSACPAYIDAAVWFGRSLGEPDKVIYEAEHLVQIDPYDRSARLVLAEAYPDPRKRLQHIRCAIRNSSIDATLANLLMDTLRRPAGQTLLAKWLEEANRALAEPDPADWPDALALESFRLAVIWKAEQGRLQEAAEYARRAAALCQRLRSRWLLRRPEPAENEVWMHLAWFNWLEDPQRWGESLFLIRQTVMADMSGPARDPATAAAIQLAGLINLARGAERSAVRDFILSDASVNVGRGLRGILGCGYGLLYSLPIDGSPKVRSLWLRRAETLLGRKRSRILESIGRKPGGGICWWRVLPLRQWLEGSD